MFSHPVAERLVVANVRDFLSSKYSWPDGMHLEILYDPTQFAERAKSDIHVQSLSMVKGCGGVPSVMLKRGPRGLDCMGTDTFVAVGLV